MNYCHPNIHLKDIGYIPLKHLNIYEIPDDPKDIPQPQCNNKLAHNIINKKFEEDYTYQQQYHIIQQPITKNEISYTVPC